MDGSISALAPTWVGWGLARAGRAICGMAIPDETGKPRGCAKGGSHWRRECDFAGVVAANSGMVGH